MIKKLKRMLEYNLFDWKYELSKKISKQMWSVE